MCILPYTDHQYDKFWQAVDRVDYASDERFNSIKNRSKNISELYEIIGEIAANLETKVLIEMLTEAEIPCGKVNKLEDLKNDPHLKDLGFFREFEHPTEGLIQVPDSAFRLNRKELPIRHHQPKLGEHSKEILLKLGYSDSEIDKILDV